MKLAAQNLLKRLTEGKPKVLVQDWFKDTQTKTKVKSTIEEVLHEMLPETYGRQIFITKCNSVFDLVYDYSAQGIKWAA